MKTPTTFMLGTLFLGALLLVGCSTTKFDEYHGSEILQGKGGVMHSVDGIDFWEHGDPDRKYKILGALETSPKKRIPLGRLSGLVSNSGDRESGIAKAAHKRGGDAVVVVAKAPDPSADASEATDGRSGHRSHQRFTFVVVKYLQ
jgi:hypothetical protein